MPDAPDGEPFEDVNEAVRAEWEAETTPAERVREVVSHAYSAVTADAIAEEARTAPKTARKHLEALASEGFVVTEPGENGGTTYRRSPESLVVEEAADILAEVSIEELRERVAEMREEVRAFEAEYDSLSPEDLTVDRTNQALAGELDGGAGEDGPSPEELREWQTTRRNLAFANAALSIATAETFVDGGPNGTDWNPTAP